MRKCSLSENLKRKQDNLWCRKNWRFCHLYIGQEAVVTGILSSIQSEDTVVTSYRDHGHILARGVDPKFVMAELTEEKMVSPKVRWFYAYVFKS